MRCGDGVLRASNVDILYKLYMYIFKFDVHWLCVLFVRYIFYKCETNSILRKSPNYARIQYGNLAIALGRRTLIFLEVEKYSLFEETAFFNILYVENTL